MRKGKTILIKMKAEDKAQSLKKPEEYNQMSFSSQVDQQGYDF